MGMQTFDPVSLCFYGSEGKYGDLLIKRGRDKNGSGQSVRWAGISRFPGSVLQFQESPETILAAPSHKAFFLSPAVPSGISEG